MAARHGSEAVLVEITMFSGRSTETVAELHLQVADELAGLGIEPHRILCVIHESPPRNWSVGGIPQDQVDVGFEIGL